MPSARVRQIIGTLVLLGVCWLGAESGAAAPGAAPAGTGLAVQPGGLLLQEIALGETYDLEQTAGVHLTIFNQDSQAHTYLLSTQRPSAVGAKLLPDGFADIVDLSWLWFDHPEVEVPAAGSAQARMYFRIPEDERYHNQRWSVMLQVASKPVPGETIALAVYPRYDLETVAAPRQGLPQKPVGEMGIVPSTVALSAMGPGEWRESQFYLCNEDARGHRYTFRLLTLQEIADKHYLGVSRGYTWMPDPAWVRTREPGAYVRRHRAVPVSFRVRLPREVKVPEGGWEAILLVTREDGLARFLRVQVSPARPADQGGRS